MPAGEGKPNIGRFFCGGVLTLDTQTHQLTRSGLYWTLAHYSRFMPRGARVVATRGNLPEIDHIAAQDPDGSRVLVLTNRGSNAGDPRQVQCAPGNKSLQLTLPANSVTTLVH
jgi:glucosylceramidase